MTIGDVCTKQVIKVRKNASINEAIYLMRNKHVGDVIVIDDNNMPVGILTDRDVVIKIIFNKVDPEMLTVGDVMSYELTALPQDSSIAEALGTMRMKGVRRAPVTNNKGQLVGVIAIDDIIALIAEELNEIALLIQHERKYEEKLTSGVTD